MEKNKLFEKLEFMFRQEVEIKRKKRELLHEFKEEFPARKNSKGYFLVGTNCGKTSCTLCPHRLVWRWYQRWDKGKVLWKKERLKKLPLSFWNSRRTEEVLERFKFYEEQAKQLNEQSELIQKVLTSINTKLYHAVRKL